MSIPTARHFKPQSNFKSLERYWSDTDYQEQVDAEATTRRNQHNRAIDEAQERNGTRWPSHWTDQEKADASAKQSGAKS